MTVARPPREDPGTMHAPAATTAIPYALRRIGVLMSPEPGNDAEAEGVINPAAARDDSAAAHFERAHRHALVVPLGDALGEPADGIGPGVCYSRHDVRVRARVGHPVPDEVRGLAYRRQGPAEGHAPAPRVAGDKGHGRVEPGPVLGRQSGTGPRDLGMHLQARVHVRPEPDVRDGP